MDMAYLRSSVVARSEMMIESGPEVGARTLEADVVVCIEQRLLWELDGVRDIGWSPENWKAESWLDEMAR